MDWLRNWMLPPQGSVYAGEVDFVYMGLFWMCALMFIGITGAVIYFSWRYRYRPGRVTPHDTHNTSLEIIWTVVPLLLCIGIFFWGLNGYMKYAVAPGEAMEIQVTAKKWLWQFEYPDGTRTVNELHVPANKPVKFIMTSEDVIHDLYVPDMRVKHDIIPGRYTEIWFTPNVLGKHRFTCAEYCGKGHSDMHGELTVEDDAAYAKFLETGGTEYLDYTPEAWGKIQYERNGCSTCHTLDGTKSKGPSWKGIWNKMEKLNNGQVVLVDEAYVRESMLYPQAKIVDGFEPIMPSFNHLLRENQITGLIAFIKSLK